MRMRNYSFRYFKEVNMLTLTPYQIAENWMTNHDCKNQTGRYSVKYKEVSKNTYQVTCGKCGAQIVIENK